MKTNPLTCIAIDDEPLALALLQNYAAKIPGLQLKHTFEDAISGAEYLANAEVDLVFLDINMPDISGLALAKTLSKKPMIIFTTAYKQFAFDGFEVGAIDYLLKPIEFKRFNQAVEKAITAKNYKSSAPAVQEDEFFFVHSEYRMVKIRFKDIEYIESMEDYIKIHRENEKPLYSLLSLKKTVELLPEQHFLRIHRSYVVPISKVKSIQNRKIHLTAAILPIGDSYALQVKQRLSVAKPIPV